MPSTWRRWQRRTIPTSARRAAIRASGGLLGSGTRPARRRRRSRSRAPRRSPSRRRPPSPSRSCRSLRRGGSLGRCRRQPDAPPPRRRRARRRRSRSRRAPSAMTTRRTSARWSPAMAAERRGYSRLAWSQLGSLPVALWAGTRPASSSAPACTPTPTPHWTPYERWWPTPRTRSTAEGGWRCWVRCSATATPSWRTHSSWPWTRRSVTVRESIRTWWSTGTGCGAGCPARPTDDGTGSGERPCPVRHRRLRPPRRSRASANIGDHVQSLASLGHLVAAPEAQLHRAAGPRGPRPTSSRAGSATRARAEDVAADGRAAHHRPGRLEYARSRRTPGPSPSAGTCTPSSSMRYGFPFHPNLRPFFVSFHCSKRELLTQEAIDYLGQYAPIGCRDWTTVDVLLSVGVPAFFSGCLTTTVSTVFPDIAERPAPGRRGGVRRRARRPVPPGAPTYLHSDDAIRFRSFTTNMYDAMDLLETYRREHPGLVTSRLHCYLPARSLGVPVDFQPKNRSDPRFAGLIDITDAEFRPHPGHDQREAPDGPHRGLLGRVARRGLRPVARDQRRRRGRSPAAARRARADAAARVDLATEVDRIADARPHRPGHRSRRRARAGRSPRASSR